MRLDRKFDILREFRFNIPEDYDHKGQLDYFMKWQGRYFERISPFLRDAIFPKSSAELIPGARYKVELCKILEETNYEECLEFVLRYKYKTILTGARGLTMLWRAAKQYLPHANQIISLDSEENLWVNPNNNLCKIPSLYLDPRYNHTRGWVIDLATCGDVWGRDHVIARFRRIK